MMTDSHEVLSTHWATQTQPSLTAKIIPLPCLLTLQNMLEEASRILTKDMDLQIIFITEPQNVHKTLCDPIRQSQTLHLANGQQVYLEGPFSESDVIFRTYTHYSAQIKIIGGSFPSTDYLPIVQLGDITTALHMYVYSAACIAALEEEKQKMAIAKQAMATAAGETFQREFMPLAHQIVADAFRQMHALYAHQQPFTNTKRDRDGNPLCKDGGILDATHREQLFARCIRDASLNFFPV